jgi:ribosome-associated protein
LKKPRARRRIINSIVEAIQDKKGEDIISLDLRDLPEAICDFYIICSGNSKPQIKAIAEEIDMKVKKAHKEYPYHREGITNMEWVILDYFDIIVHVFEKDKRAFYKLDELWSDAKLTVYND